MSPGNHPIAWKKLLETKERSDPTFSWTSTLPDLDFYPLLWDSFLPVQVLGTLQVSSLTLKISNNPSVLDCASCIVEIKILM